MINDNEEKENLIYNNGEDMTGNNILVDKSISFSIRIVNCYKYLTDRNEFVMSKQLIRSGTSIGANIHEAIQAQSKSDFISKLNIALKEASESSYWITLLFKTGYIEECEYLSLKNDLDEIIKILTSSIKTSKRNNI